MKKLFLLICTSATLSLFSSFAQAEKNAELYQHGEETHEAHCNKCHTSSVYTRETRFVKSMEALSKQVRRCKDNLGIAWFDEDTEAVAHFLNEKYYKF
ncbi:MAG: cytochrome c [Gammaproteobacteria bacterium]|nr:cytochrome c [Gammaproteobacteria bacterium]